MYRNGLFVPLTLKSQLHEKVFAMPANCFIFDFQLASCKRNGLLAICVRLMAALFSGRAQTYFFLNTKYQILKRQSHWSWLQLTPIIHSANLMYSPNFYWYSRDTLSCSSCLWDCVRSQTGTVVTNSLYTSRSPLLCPFASYYTVLLFRAF